MIRQNAAPGSSPSLHSCPEAKTKFMELSERPVITILEIHIQYPQLKFGQGPSIGKKSHQTSQ